MGEIINQLGQLFVQSIPTIVIVFLLIFFLDRLFFKPLSRTLEARANATTGALKKAREQAVAAEEKTRQYEQSFQAARQKVYRQQEAIRQDALKEREAAVQKAREQADRMFKEAQDSIAAEVASAKADLQSSIESLAREITDQILTGGQVPSPQGEVQV